MVEATASENTEFAFVGTFVFELQANSFSGMEVLSGSAGHLRTPIFRFVESSLAWWEVCFRRLTEYVE